MNEAKPFGAPDSTQEPEEDPLSYLWVSREWKNVSSSSYNCTPFLHSLLTKGKLYDPRHSEPRFHPGPCSGSQPPSVLVLASESRTRKLETKTFDTASRLACFDFKSPPQSPFKHQSIKRKSRRALNSTAGKDPDLQRQNYL